jgi:hypothetical protein
MFYNFQRKNYVYTLDTIMYLLGGALVEDSVDEKVDEPVDESVDSVLQSEHF